jgi:PPOX class probable FMN-dependent enzyme
MSKIETIEQLRDVVGDPHPGLGEKNIDHIDEFARDFITRSPFLVLSTSSADGRIDASPKGDEPGFVKVLDEQSIVIPDRSGNKLAYGHQNILSNPHVGVLFMIPNTPETLRINGRAELRADPELLDQLAARGKSAVLAIKVTVEECFFHCGKAFIRSGLWQSEDWPEQHRVSFGTMYAKRKRKPADVASAIDQAIAADYRENL